MAGMSGRETIKERISDILSSSSSNAFLRSEFAGLGGERQVARSLASLVIEGNLVRVGYGIYAKARPSGISGRPIPLDTIENIALEVMRKLGVPADLGPDARALREGRSTQIPMAPVISIGKARVCRKIGFGNRQVLFERLSRMRRKN